MTGFNTMISNAGYGLAMRALFRAGFRPRTLRRNFEAFAATPRERLERRFPALRFRDEQVGEVQAERIATVDRPERVMLYLHGGAFVFGSVATYRRRAMKLAHRCSAEVLVPDYRLAPEHPFPAALDDAHAAWRRLLELADGRPALVAGDSAGGGLALSLLARLGERGDAMPAGVIAISPWTDLALEGPSFLANRHRDCWIDTARLATWSAMYRAGHCPRDPAVSPVHADPRGWPPLLLMAGDQEVLLDDARRMHASALAAGVDSHLDVGRGMQHDWMLTLPWLRESERAWRRIEGFARAAGEAAVHGDG